MERTTNFRLDPWQQILCARLEKLKDQTGQRLLIHAAPQHGKSIIVSQRFPAWLLGHKPEHRIKLACYNISHASRFAWMVRDVMQGAEFSEMFPDPDCRVPEGAARGEWSTLARGRLRDAQPSLMALGLLTGFVGQGADTLLIDDPYASPQDALSAVIRESVWTFWEAGAKVRLNDDTNVVAMFHRYHQDDLAGRLLASGGWEELRFSAQAEEGEPDPLGRSPGEYLSRRYSEAFYEEQKRNQSVWLSQFQGRPIDKDGAFFKVANFSRLATAPAGLRYCRAWDLGATTSGDPTAGVKLGTDGERYYVRHVQRGRWATDDRNRVLRSAAEADGRECRVHLPQDPGQAGKDQALALTRLLAGYPVKVEPVSGSKEVRADPWSAQVNAGNVVLIDDGTWDVNAFIEEHRAFPLGTHDDQVDAASDAFAELAGSTTGPAQRIARPSLPSRLSF